MDKIYKPGMAAIYGLLTVAAGAFCTPAESKAQDQMCVGYVNPQETVYPYTGFSNSSSEGGTLYFVVRMDGSLFSNYEGASLTGLRVGWSMGSTPLTPEMEVFVREDLNGADLASGSAQVSFGWNDVKFDTPYEIVSGKDLYLGGKVAWEPDSWLGTGIFGYSLPEGCQFIGNADEVDEDGNIKWIDVTDNSMVIMALGLVEASGEQFQDKAMLTGFRANEIQSLASPGNAWLIIRNDGSNALQEVELSASLGDGIWSHTLQFSTPIAGGDQKEVVGGIQALGTGVHDIWISKVNGKETEKTDPLNFNFIAVPEDVAAGYTRRPLVERWVSESEYRTPVYTDDIFMPGIEPFRDSFSMLSHHFSDQFMIYHEFDAEIDNEDIKFLVDFADGDRNRVSVPSFTVDRSYLPANPLAHTNDLSVAYNFIYPQFVEGMYASALDVPTFASIEVSPAVDNGICGIEVSGNIEPGIMPEGENLHLTVYLVEDNVESKSQEFPDDEETVNRYKGVYTHQDLIRLSLTEMYGDRLDGEGEFSRKFSCELEPEWNIGNMRVLALLNRSGESHGHMQVINSCETSLKGSGVQGMAAMTEKGFGIHGRDIVPLPGFTTEVYTAAGTRVSGTGLCPGVYLVRSAGAAGTVTRKVIIK